MKNLKLTFNIATCAFIIQSLQTHALSSKALLSPINLLALLMITVGLYLFLKKEKKKPTYTKNYRY